MPIVLENVSYTYQPGTPFAAAALREVSLTVKSGELVGLIGHTGSGKSTLIQHCNGLLFPQAGRVTVDGLPVAPKSKDLREIRRKVGLVFQYPEQQLFEETVELDIAFGPKSLGLGEAETRRRTRWAMGMVELDEKLAGASPFSLSGGEKRRVAIAGVLASRPKYLILDEPCAGLDPQGREEMLRQLRRLNEKGLAILLVSHSMDDVARLVRRLVVIHQGRILYDDPVRQVFARAAEMAELGLDVPEVMKLMLLLREKGLPARQDILTAEEGQEEILRVLSHA
ncbi:MAG: energy-coupling factor transporter ATPase [Peptococcaceae bacterium]|jgi:energy-coupling factor transport system ATP-binding protein|nr:energy-coupling factor transporter ATPase [Peptococcaceae bacterium]